MTTDEREGERLVKIKVIGGFELFFWQIHGLWPGVWVSGGPLLKTFGGVERNARRWLAKHAPDVRVVEVL